MNTRREVTECSLSSVFLPSDEVPPRRIRLSAERREVQLLDIAENLFTEHGYEGVTMEDIARAAGVSRPIVYQHLGSKDGAFVACVRRARQQFEEAIAASISPVFGDLSARIQAGGNVYFDLIANNPKRWSLLFATSASLEGHLADQLYTLRAGTIAAIAVAVKQYAPDATKEATDAFAHIVSGIGEQLGRWWLANPKISRKRVMSYYVTSIEGAAQAILALPHTRTRRRTHS